MLMLISRWIREMEGTKLKVTNASDPNYMRTLERAIRIGESVLLQVFYLFCGKLLNNATYSFKHQLLGIPGLKITQFTIVLTVILSLDNL